MLNNRELAALIWLGGAALWALSQEKVRGSLARVVKTFFQPLILIPLIAMLAWVGLELWVAVQLVLWNPVLTKSTILWTLGSAGVLLFKWPQVATDPHFFQRTIGLTVGVAVFVEFFVNLYVMSLPVELMLQFVVVVLGLMAALGGLKPEYKSAKTFCEVVLAVIGFTLLIFTVQRFYLGRDQLDKSALLLEFVLPIWLTGGLLPFIYGVSIYGVYDAVFRRINWETNESRSRWRCRLALLSMLHVRTSVVEKFTGYWTRQLSEASTLSAARGVVAEFLSECRRKKQALIDEEERLRCYTGSQETDEESRRLDRREFAATIAALRWLGTCQMGWYRNDGHRYRDDMLKIVGDFTRHGLPTESGITLRVANDGQSWYAWRRTMTGWCFAIGAAGPPPNQWEYDGPEPPKGFPGRDSAWGDAPFSDQVNRNWR